jgi:peroxiredoxin
VPRSYDSFLTSDLHAVPSRRTLFVTALIVVGAAVVVWGPPLPGAGVASVSAGSPAPDFRAATLDVPSRTKTIADYRGDVVLLNIWATWCGPCEWEMPGIQSLYERFAPAGFKVVAVAVDDPGFEQRIRDFVARHRLTFEILHEGSGKIEADYQALGIPATYLIGRDGIIRKRVAGASNWDTDANRALVAQLLGVGASSPGQGQ